VLPYQVEIFTCFDRRLVMKGSVVGSAAGTVTLHLGEDVFQVPVAHDGERLHFDFRTMISTDQPWEGHLVVTDGGSVWRVDHLYQAVEPAHLLYPHFLSMLEGQGDFLEIGARARSGISRRDAVPDGWNYTGFDIIAGENVDVVGDAHQLSRHFDQKFDAVMALSVLEHILMPWKMIVELNRVMKPGGIGFFLTHQGWPVHDAPWDFWRFSDQSWRALLNAATGFEIIEARMGEPTFVVPQRLHPVNAFGMGQYSYLVSSVLFRKVGDTTLDWPVEVADITATHYPES